MNKQDRVLSLVGIAAKAGKVASGEFSVEKSIKTGFASLVIVSGDASDNTKKKFHNSCTYYDIPCVIYSDKENLGKSIGKQMRACLSVQDEQLAKAILEKITELKNTINDEGRSN